VKGLRLLVVQRVEEVDPVLIHLKYSHRRSLILPVFRIRIRLDTDLLYFHGSGPVQILLLLKNVRKNFIIRSIPYVYFVLIVTNCTVFICLEENFQR
jgi:hypothetical protein